MKSNEARSFILTNAIKTQDIYQTYSHHCLLNVFNPTSLHDVWQCSIKITKWLTRDRIPWNSHHKRNQEFVIKQHSLDGKRPSRIAERTALRIQISSPAHRMQTFLGLFRLQVEKKNQTQQNIFCSRKKRRRAVPHYPTSVFHRQRCPLCLIQSTASF